jgi:hypothetical protein
LLMLGHIIFVLLHLNQCGSGFTTLLMPVVLKINPSYGHIIIIIIKEAWQKQTPDLNATGQASFQLCVQQEKKRVLAFLVSGV